MANTVGGLVVTLALDDAEYKRGLTRAERQAQQFAQKTRAAIQEVGKVLGGLAIGAVVLETTKAIIAEAAALNDLASATGSTVEEMSRLNNQARIAGADFNKLNDAVLKLGAGMSGADGKGQQVNETLKLLGITAKDPAEVLQQVAVKLSTYADGVNKIGLAQRLFGGTGREFLKVLQDMAELQDVQATVTAKQAREAEELERAWQRLSAESTTFRNAILSNVVPVLLNVIQNFNDARKAGLGFLDALELAGHTQNDVSEQIAVVTEKLEDAKKAVAAAANNPLRFIPGLTADIKDVEKLEKRLQALRTINVRGLEVFDKEKIKPQAPSPPGGATGRARALKEATDEGLRYQQSLEKQLQATLELNHEETARVAIFDALRKGQAGFTAEVQANILDMARQLDTTQALKKSEDERKKAAEDAARAEERISQATNSWIKSARQEVDSLKAGNEQLAEQILFLKGGEEAVNRLADAKLAEAIATKEGELAAISWNDANEMAIDATREQIRLLRERQVLLGDKRAAEAAAEQAKKAKQFADDLGNALAQGAENAILHFNKMRDVLKSLEQDLVRIITRKLVTQPLGDFLSTAIGAGLSGFSMPAFASGGTSSGGWAMVGERGPEAVHLPRGAQVIPNSELMARRSQRQGDINIHVNVPGSTSSTTADQIAVRTGMAVRRALNRNA